MLPPVAAVCIRVRQSAASLYRFDQASESADGFPRHIKQLDHFSEALMPVLPFPPLVQAEQAAPDPDPIPFDQAELDRLYWDDSGTVKVADIAALFGVPASKIAKLATPKATAVRCLVCGAHAAVRSRSQLGAEWIDCAGCGAACRQRESRSAEYRRQQRADVSPPLHSVGVSTALVRRRPGVSHRDVGFDAHDAIDALRRLGRPIDPDGLVTVLETTDGIDQIREALSEHQPAVLGVSSLRVLGQSQTEALQNLFSLTRDGWRLVSASDIEVTHSVRFAEMNALSWGEHRVRDDRWQDESEYDMAGEMCFGDRLINATAQSNHRSRH